MVQERVGGAVQARGITKRFPGVLALDDISLDVASGSCHALLGENGAGKSTLGKILAGIYTPDGGEIVLDGQPMRFRSPRDAGEAGVAMVHQEPTFCENLTVAENLCLGDLPRKGIWLDEKEALRRAQGWLDAVAAGVDPRRRLGELPIGKRQLVQIASALGRGARVLVFDEPTSSLSRGEADRLMEIVKELKARGTTCLYVSHRLEEIFALCDTVTVLRDGRLVDTVPLAGLTREDLVRMMIGRELAASLAEHDEFAQGDELLRVEGLSSPGRVQSISFSVRGGEILGFAGLVGAGRTEAMEAIFGLDPQAAGEVSVRGKPVPLGGSGRAMKMGLGLVPEDRKRQGLVLGMSIKENVSLPTLSRLATLGWVRGRRERAVVGQYFDRMRVRAPGIDTAAMGLSGGNQQKLVLAKWLAADCDVLLVDEPTRGVDVGAKAEIHNLLRDLAVSGKAVIVVSSDLPELLALATRVLVMREAVSSASYPEGRPRRRRCG